MDKNNRATKSITATNIVKKWLPDMGYTTSKADDMAVLEMGTTSFVIVDHKHVNGKMVHIVFQNVSPPYVAIVYHITNSVVYGQSVRLAKATIIDVTVEKIKK